MVGVKMTRNRRNSVRVTDLFRAVDKVFKVIKGPDVNDTLSVGQVVQFYDEGLRAGHIEKIKGTKATIRPIGPSGKKQKTIVLDVKDVMIVRKEEKYVLPL